MLLPISKVRKCYYYFAIKAEEKTEFYECTREKFLVHFILFVLLSKKGLYPNRFEIKIILLLIQ